jgi:hypothetical protein
MRRCVPAVRVLSGFEERDAKAREKFDACADEKFSLPGPEPSGFQPNKSADGIACSW